MEATTLFTLSFLFLSFTTNGVYASHGIFNIVDDQPPEVLDSSGNKLQQGEYYYIRPLLKLPRLYTAAIVPSIYRHGTTWFQLEIENFVFQITGLPVAFTPVVITDNEDDSIRVSTDLHIQLSEDELSSSVFGETPVWKVERIEPFVTLGGAYEDKSSWFKIEKASEVHDRTYKLVSCLGRNVGISNRAYGTKRLALVNEPLPFVFVHGKEAQPPTASIGNF